MGPLSDAAVKREPSNDDRVGVSGRSPFSTVIRGLAAIVLGWLLCEGLVRILVPVPIFYSTWFTPGVHERDPSLGFVFKPNYVGAMRHADRVWYETLKLDGNGFRRTASGPAERDAENGETIVMLGGASMAFSFGLSDGETLHHQTARQLREPTTIELVSWPGFTLGQDLVKLDRFLDESAIDRAIVFAYSDDDYAFVNALPASVPPAVIPMDHGVVLPQDPASQILGWPYYRSVVLAGASRWWMALAAIVGLEDDHTAGQSASGPRGKSDATDTQSGLPAALLAARRLREDGISSVLVVALPHQLRKIGPKSLREFAGDGVEILDLRRMASDEEMDWIAGGHYGPRSTQAIAGRIAESIMSDSRE